ncbi:putative transcriptional regulator [Candidatus Nitrosopumilus koreensis AR1]|uniref:Putative transcriptional regulator n=1 Tax=Candidatus Nitrosopumilus koreensis AR1 TaxID=1229908 RepID=K0B7Y7_9ARCH|nr:MULTISPECIES: winged helix-turn-helix domain-containing protein [Nitrosopumilus]AFS81075.1 putative transcriptional regulator [Candidatus Nitrosopumilus koreensis AR1]
MNRKERRGKLEIYYDVLTAIKNESTNIGVIKPTRLQYGSNLSYDKLTNYLHDLKQKEMVMKNGGIKILERGREFMEEYCNIRKQIKKLGLEFT